MGKGKLTKSTYKRLTNRPKQAEGRALLHKAVKDSAHALQLMWDSFFDYHKKSFAQDGSEMLGKYRFALLYFIKYLMEEKEFDVVATEKNMPIHLVIRRGDGAALFCSNSFESQEAVVLDVLFDTMAAVAPFLADDDVYELMLPLADKVRAKIVASRPPKAEASTDKQASRAETQGS